MFGTKDTFWPMRHVERGLAWTCVVLSVLAEPACGGDVDGASSDRSAPDGRQVDSAGAGAGGATSAGSAGVAGEAGRGGRAGISGGGVAGMGGAGAGGRGGSGGAGGAGAGGTGAGGSAGPIRVFLAGDSTVANGVTPCPTGWGKYFDTQFDDRIIVVNRAAGGRSVRTWLYNVQTTMDDTGECDLATDAMGEPTLQARWQQTLDEMQPGDYLLIQFGINDSSPTCDRHVGLDAFIESYGYMADAALERGAHPIFITPASSIACDGSTPRPTRGAYADAAKDAAARYDVPVFDLEAATVALYADRGFCPVPGGDVSASTGGAVGEFFCDDHTHFSDSGARAIAELVSEGLADLNVGLSSYLAP